MSILEELDPDGGWSHDSSHEQLGELIDFIDSLIITKERRQVRLFTFYELENRFPTVSYHLFNTWICVYYCYNNSLVYLFQPD